MSTCPSPPRRIAIWRRPPATPQACADFDDTVTVLIGNPGDDLDVVVHDQRHRLRVAPRRSRCPSWSARSPTVPTPSRLTIDGVGASRHRRAVRLRSGLRRGQRCATRSTPAAPSTNVLVQHHQHREHRRSRSPGTVAARQRCRPARPSPISSATAPLVLLHNLVRHRSGRGHSRPKCERTVIIKKELDGSTGDRRDLHDSGVSPRRRDTTSSRADVRHQRQRVQDHSPCLRHSTRPASPTRSTRSTPARPAPVRSLRTPLTLSVNLGETVNVVVTNGYASVADRQDDVDAPSSCPVDRSPTRSQATNTGGLTLNPVVIG